jgi:hypothetical protein
MTFVVPKEVVALLVEIFCTTGAGIPSSIGNLKRSGGTLEVMCMELFNCSL